MPDRHWYTIVALVLAIQIIALAWWLPQKWQACQRLYDNRPAQLVCLSSGS